MRLSYDTATGMAAVTNVDADRTVRMTETLIALPTPDLDNHVIDIPDGFYVIDPGLRRRLVTGGAVAASPADVVDLITRTLARRVRRPDAPDAPKA